MTPDELLDKIAEFPADPQDTRQWRVGSHYGIHLYAMNPDGDDEPIGTALTLEVARQIIAEHSFATAPYSDLGHTGGSWVQILMRLLAENLRLRAEIEGKP